jgi:hypothetical protein
VAPHTCPTTVASAADVPAPARLLRLLECSGTGLTVANSEVIIFIEYQIFTTYM